MLFVNQSTSHLFLQFGEEFPQDWELSFTGKRARLADHYYAEHTTIFETFQYPACFKDNLTTDTEAPTILKIMNFTSLMEECVMTCKRYIFR